ncbi:MAG: hypothetical protein JXA90_12805 [Planctomycetes bacterium]|nr:hypothetical protein [Planctomycetota bacterium]
MNDDSNPHKRWRPGRILFPAVALVLPLVCGCAVYWEGHQPEMMSRGTVQEVTLNQKNFRIVKSHVEGEASCFHLFWLDHPERFVGLMYSTLPVVSIPLGDPDVYERAMADLHSKHDLLGKAQVLHNIHEEYVVTNYLWVFADVKLKVFADVIEFVEEPRS